MDKRSELIDAAYAGDAARVKQLLKKGADPNEVWTFTEVVDRGTQFEQTRTVLMSAAEYGHLEVVKLLLSYGANKNVTDSTGSSPLLMAIKTGREAIANLLIDSGASVNAHDGFSDDTPLSAAADRGLADLVDKLLAKKADVTGAVGAKAVRMAAFRGHQAIVEKLLAHGAPANEALSSAAMSGNVDLMEKLAGGAPSQRDLNIALYAAAGRGDLAMVRKLVDKGADINWINEYRWTPLTTAAYNGHRPVVELFLSKGADAAVVDTKGKTAIDWCMENGNTEMVTLLQQKTSQQEKPSAGQITRGMIAAAYEGKADMVQMLLDQGADINGKDSLKRTALMMAAFGGRESIVRMLLKRGADPTPRDFFKQDAAEAAESYGHRSIASLIRNATKKP